MIRHLMIVAALAAATTATLVGQARPAFEVASIRPSPEQPPDQAQIGLRITNQQLRMSYLTLKDYLGMAYRLGTSQISGPDWISTARFEIAATMPAGANRDQLPEMLQSLFEERFQMRSHRESREFSVYALEVAEGGLKLVRIKDDPAAAPAPDAPVTVAAGGSAAGVTVDLGGGASFSLANNKFEARRVTMTALAETLTRFVDRTVVDQTKVEGLYDVSLDLTPEDYSGMLIRSAVSAGVRLPPQVLRILDTASLGSLFDSLNRTGLSMEGRRAPLDVLVIDSVQRTPTEN